MTTFCFHLSQRKPRLREKCARGVRQDSSGRSVMCNNRKHKRKRKNSTRLIPNRPSSSCLRRRVIRQNYTKKVKRSATSSLMLRIELKSKAPAFQEYRIKIVLLKFRTNQMLAKSILATRGKAHLLSSQRIM